jgi:hypothetical protein
MRLWALVPNRALLLQDDADAHDCASGETYGDQTTYINLEDAYCFQRCAALL